MAVVDVSSSPFHARPFQSPPRVEDAVVYASNLGPWDTKSGGKMNIVFAFNEEILKNLSDVDQRELDLVPQLELGYRAFHSTGLAAGSIGGRHFHRIKQETIALPKGKVEFLLEDLYGGSRRVTLDKINRSLFIPPFIMHTYTVIEEAELIGVSNTLYDADNPATHDTYETDTFDRLASYYR